MWGQAPVIPLPAAPGVLVAQIHVLGRLPLRQLVLRRVRRRRPRASLRPVSSWDTSLALERSRVRHGNMASRTVGASKGLVRFVNVDSGFFGRTKSSGFSVTAWTLRTSELEWETAGVLQVDDLWTQRSKILICHSGRRNSLSWARRMLIFSTSYYGSVATIQRIRWSRSTCLWDGVMMSSFFDEASLRWYSSNFLFWMLNEASLRCYFSNFLFLGCYWPNFSFLRKEN